MNIKTVFKVVAGGLTVVSAMEVLSRWSSFDQLVAAVQTCVLPAGTRLVQITDGCVCLTVQAESLSALKFLWKFYQDGTLQKHLHDFFVTDEVRELADGEDVEVNVTIDEGEYQKACVELIQGAQGDLAFDSFFSEFMSPDFHTDRVKCSLMHIFFRFRILMYLWLFTI